MHLAWIVDKEKIHCIQQVRLSRVYTKFSERLALEGVVAIVCSQSEKAA